MKLFNHIKDKIPFELKRGTSVASIILALIFTGIITRLGEVIFDTILSFFNKVYITKVWDTITWVASISFKVNLIGIIIFIIILFPIYRKLDKYFFVVLEMG